MEAAEIKDKVSARLGLDDAAGADLHRGIDQVLAYWRPDDGDDAELENFLATAFARDSGIRDALFERMQRVLASIEGHHTEVTRDLRMHADVEAGPVLAFDEVLAGYDPGAHVVEDLFANKIAFTVLLNFPLTAREERDRAGAAWSRRQWAEARLAQRFSRRTPPDALLALAGAEAVAESYVSGYNIWTHHLVDGGGDRLFPAGQRLISHWNLRDEITARYADGPAGPAPQRMIQQVMERIVDQSIPQAVIDNPYVDWEPVDNQVLASSKIDFGDHPAPDVPISAAREPDTRYARMLDLFRAVRLVDEHSPRAPTLLARQFDDGWEIAEDRVEGMLTEILGSPVMARIGRLISDRLGRPLEPFDIWYPDLLTDADQPAVDLDLMTRERYPDSAAFAADIPRLLTELGFSAERAAYVADRVEVHPSRGAGHAYGAGLRGARSYLRTRVEAGGMDYKGYNIAVHELGHNVEQTFSLNDIDHHLLSGVPNNACTEALAFVFQGRDLELLGVAPARGDGEDLAVLQRCWDTYEVSGVALLELEVWRWLYGHPGADATQLREAVTDIARDVWNCWFAPVIGSEDSLLLGIYSHMISIPLYLPNYAIGFLIAFQIEEHMGRIGAIGPEFERISRIGRLSPDRWMVEAVGAPVGPGALLDAAEGALNRRGLP